MGTIFALNAHFNRKMATVRTFLLLSFKIKCGLKGKGYLLFA
jgi:hypothetical protein